MVVDNPNDKNNIGEIRNDAYHGTSLENAMSILKEGFRPGPGIIGIGAYFDLENVDSAIAKALERVNDDRSQATIIQAEVALGRSIDLSFDTNPIIREEFRRWQRLNRPQLRELSFSAQREAFIQECCPDINTATYYDADTQTTVICVRQTERIVILSARTLDGKVIR